MENGKRVEKLYFQIEEQLLIWSERDREEDRDDE